MIVYISRYKSSVICSHNMITLGKRLGLPERLLGWLRRFCPYNPTEKPVQRREVRVNVIEDDVASMPDTVALIMIPLLDRLVAHVESNAEYQPPGETTREKWLEILADIRYAFAARYEDVQDETRISSGKLLFAIHYEDLKTSHVGKDQQLSN